VARRRAVLSYAILKFLHIVGVVLLLGNVTATAVWKVFADRTRDPMTVAYAQRLVTYTDWALTGSGIVLIVVGGYGMAIVAGMPLFEAGWMVWAQVMFAVSGAIWLGVLVPIQIAQARLSAQFKAGVPVPAAYWRLGTRWIVWGVLATVPLVAALFLMVVKTIPGL
jgi:uncharacterized membrane protein